jgi:O-antigen ligase
LAIFNSVPFWANLRDWFGARDKGREFVAPLVLVIPLSLLLVKGGPHYFAGFAMLAIAGLLFIANTRVFMLGFLVVVAMRNWVAGGDRIDVGILTFDLGGLLNVMTTLMGIVYFLVLWRNPFKGRSLTWPYLVFWGLFAISLPWAPDFRQGIRFTTRLLAPFVTYLILSDLMDKKMARGIIKAMYLSSVVPISYGLMEMITGRGNLVTDGYIRIQSCFSHPANFSMYLMFMFCVAYATLLDKKAKYPILMVGYIGVLVLLLVATYTRISWLGTIVCFVYLSWVYGRRRYAIMAFVVGAIALPVLGRDILERIQAIEIFLDSSDLTDRNNSMGWRFYFWTHLIDAWKEQPWFGYGTGSSIVFGKELMGVWTSPHNGYLRVLYETGIVGFMAFMWVIGTMLGQAFRLLRQNLNQEVKLVAHIYVTMILAYLILNLTDNILEYYEVAIYNWAILSLVEYTNRVGEEEGIFDEVDDEDFTIPTERLVSITGPGKQDEWEPA